MCTSPEPQAHRPPRQRGVTLVELVVALALAGVVISGLISAWALLGQRSADPIEARQQLAIGQSLLREIELQALPGDAQAAPTPGRTGFASISDYHGLTLNGISDVEGNALPGLASYSAAVSVSALALEGVPADQGWWVTVRVTGPSGQFIDLAMWRARR
jgi:MSHA pilin protein MshD